jgi:quinol monooxygenase YgiN
MIHVVATVLLKPGTRAAFLSEFRKLVPLVRAEDGCIEYSPAVYPLSEAAAETPDRADVVIVIEKWRDSDALKAHLAAPHMADYRGRVRAMVEEVQLQVLEPVV